MGKNFSRRLLLGFDEPVGYLTRRRKKKEGEVVKTPSEPIIWSLAFMAFEEEKWRVMIWPSFAAKV